MARKPNYDFERRRKEQERKTKKEDKARRKLENAANGTDENGDPIVDGADAMDGTVADPSASGTVAPE
jgi:hypothetical protein